MQQKKLLKKMSVTNWLEYVDLANLKSDIDKFDISELEKIPSSLNSFKSIVDNLDVGKMKTFSQLYTKKKGCV